MRLSQLGAQFTPYPTAPTDLIGEAYAVEGAKRWQERGKSLILMPKSKPINKRVKA